MRNASRVAAMFFKVPLRFDQITSGPALGIPAYVILAGLDAFINNGTVIAAYSANRAAGAPWALALERAVPHHALSPAQRDLTIDWMNTVLGMRLGNAPSYPLRAIIESGRCVHVVRVAGDQAPFTLLVLPDVRESALDRLAGERGVSGGLNCFSTHDDCEIAVDPDLFDSALE